MNQQELTPEFIRELKQYIAGQYTGCYVLRFDNSNTVYQINTAYYSAACADTAYLLLRPLSSMNYDEAIELFRLEHNYRMTRFKFEKLSTGKIVGLYGYNDTIINCGLHFHCLKFTSYQYLQQQGFALPVYFKGTLFSVEKLTELGIIKLKE